MLVRLRCVRGQWAGHEVLLGDANSAGSRCFARGKLDAHGLGRLGARVLHSWTADHLVNLERQRLLLLPFGGP